MSPTEPTAAGTDARQDRTGGLTAVRRAHIRRVAGDHFAEFGYHGASLRQMAAASGLTQGHLYYYYPSKQDLLHEVIAGVQVQFNDIMDSGLIRTAGPEQVLTDVLTGHVRILCANVTDVRVSYESLRFLTAAHRVELIAARDRYEAGVRQLIDAMRRSGEVAPAQTPLLAKVVLGVVNWPYQWYRADGSTPAEELAALLAGRAMAALR
jgi:AcrR family transcriptional regulator